MVLPPREWVYNNVMSRQVCSNDASMKVILCTPPMSRKVLSRAQPAGQANDLELIPMVQMESQHAIGAPTCHDFPRFVIISEKSQLEVANRWRWSRFLGKKDPLRANFPKIIAKGCTTSQNHVLCANFVKFGCEIWLTGNRQSRALFTWQKDKTSARSPALRAQNLSGTAPNNILGVPQIPPKSVHFRRSYSRTREHRSNAPQSVSNTRRSFFAE